MTDCSRRNWQQRSQRSPIKKKKGKDILLLNMEGLSFMTDYFVIISAGNTTLVKAIADEIEDKLAQTGRTLYA